MFCNQFENEGVLYLYGELNADEKKKFEAHILNCSKCSLAVRQFNETRGIYREFETEAPSRGTLFLLKLKIKKFHYSTAFKKYLSKLFEPKKLWIPAIITSVALIFICLSLFGRFNEKQNIAVNPGEILVWTILSDDSINSLDQQIEGIFAEKFTINETKEVDNQIKSKDFTFDEDLGLNEIQQDIIFLSWDINQSYF